MTFEKKKVAEHKICLIFSATIVWNIAHSKKNSAIYYHKFTQVFIRGTRYSCHILTKLALSPQISEKRANKNFMKIRPVGAELFHADWLTDRQTDRQADMMKLTVAFRYFANAPKNSTFCPQGVLYVFRMDHRKIRAYLPMVHKLADFITEKKSVYCAIRTEFLNIIQMNFNL
jgi:hypothetical protein